MSGGSYDYAFSKLNSFIEEFEKRADTWRRKLFLEHLRKVSDAMKAIEWVDSGDTSLESEDAAISKCMSEIDIDNALRLGLFRIMNNFKAGIDFGPRIKTKKTKRVKTKSV